jgi:hypothetical protein
MSVVGRMAFEFLSGTNWRGQRFTTLDEFLGVDQKGVYKTGVKKGLPKGGKDFHHLTSETRRGLGPVKTSEMPSFLLAQIAQVLPIQAQALVNLMLGEVDGWDATLQAAGVHSASPYRTDYDLIAERIKEAEDKLLEARAFGTGEQRSQILRRYRVELRAANNWHRFNRDILKLAALQAREEIIDEGSPKAKALEERVRLKQQQFVNWFGRLK